MSINKLKNYLPIVFLCALAIISSACHAAAPGVEYKKVTILPGSGKTKISWVITNNNANYFEVQKSMNGKDFTSVVFVLGSDPADKSGCNYECFDEHKAGVKKCYYRIKHVDAQGKEKFSDVTVVTFN